ncbi:MAG: 2-amino-4-hydroxy-6-hydroxymethyldihydropteridine diphosphokinase [Armatimonadetes bacterium]|nr:2-amino-4-hydroxy-6-hydroxymethyldihydropteridine diphosphokinase [Armatimonadota bacterium]
MSATPVVIGLGANLGDRRANIGRAIELLAGSLVIERVSGLYETAPMYISDQPPFLNAVLSARCEIGPLELVRTLKQIEQRVGRMERIRNGPREIDLDLLLYGSLVLASQTDAPVVVPHPRLGERRFVLEPLMEVDPYAVIPQNGAVATLLQKQDVQAQTVRRVSDAPIPIPCAR